jgi:hypothetical protein
MPATHKLRIIDAPRPNLRSTKSHSKPALGVRIWAVLLTALREPREREAARVIHRHRGLIQNFRAIELSSRKAGSNGHG